MAPKPLDRQCGNTGWTPLSLRIVRLRIGQSVREGEGMPLRGCPRASREPGDLPGITALSGASFRLASSTEVVMAPVSICSVSGCLHAIAMDR